ncbi:Protein of unknown function (DUF3466) [Idiomarina sp. A28L]|uniref:DUF3466 family protein n=1 Tax=Idiomarina sp. A28L TaxID=1036674 RepID=UPI000213898A|nr:DUF3466 family protein [Idiomarina sp. A28L]EGN75799.1 Protein of unknown function (DUF3466) [Idiomarina sp. A28L]
MRKTKISLAVAALIGSTLAVGGAAAESGGYRVTDAGAVEGAIHTTPRAINNSGHVVGQLADLRGQNLRLDLLDPEAFTSISDLDNPTERERRQLRDYLVNTVGVDPKFQNLAIELGFYFDSSNIFELDGFEALDDETGLRTDSVSFRVLGLNNLGVAVGQSSTPYQWVEDTDGDGEPARFHLRSSFPQGAWTDGENYTLVTGEPGLLMNGTASLFAINDNNVAVGYGAVAHGASLQSYYDNACISEDEVDESGETIFLEPEEACLHRYWYARSGITGASSPLMEEEAYRWVFDAQGNVLEQGSLGIAFDKEADEADVFETLRYRSVANDINIHGIAVGVSQRQVSGGSFTRPTLFNENGAIRMLEDTNTSNNSLAVAINDNNIAVGFSNIAINNNFRQRLFYMDVSNGVSEAVYPNGFFDDSSWQPRAINNSGQVVGQGQIDSTQNSQRRATGFLYEIDTNTIIDLNTYLPCNSEYVILDAIDINDAGEIAALAVLVTDIDEDGDLISTARLRSLVLTPDGSDVACPESDEVQLERKGAANHPLWLGVLALLAVISLRRRKITI